MRGHFGFEEQCIYRHRCAAAPTNSQARVRFTVALGRFREGSAEHGFDARDALALVQYVDQYLPQN